MEKQTTETSTPYLFVQFTNITVTCLIALRLLAFPLETTGINWLENLKPIWQFSSLLIGTLILMLGINWLLAKIVQLVRHQGKVDYPERFLNFLFVVTLLSGIILTYFFQENKQLFWLLLSLGLISLIFLGILANKRFAASVSPHAGWQVAWWLGTFIGLGLGGGFNLSAGLILGFQAIIIISLISILSLALGFYLAWLFRYLFSFSFRRTYHYKMKGRLYCWELKHKLK